MTLCHNCESTPAGCESVRTLAGRTCCQRCNHDKAASDSVGEEQP